MEAIQQRIVEALLADHGNKVFRQVAFALVPVTGKWRYLDIFQLTPVSPEAPRQSGVMFSNPFVIETVYKDSPDRFIALMRAREAVRAVNLILSGLIPWIIDQSRVGIEQQWAVVLDGSPGSTRRSVWTQSAYVFDGFQAEAEHFSAHSNPQMEPIEHDAYYAVSGISGGEVLQVPDSLESMLDAFHRLDPDRQNRFRRWCYWLNHATLVAGISGSARYMAMIQAVEAVRPNASRGLACPSCGRGTGPGPTSQFIEFMDRYVPRQDDTSETERRKLYRLRSGLAHGGKLLREDMEFGLDFHPDRLAEVYASRDASRLARMAGINWLRDPFRT